MRYWCSIFFRQRFSKSCPISSEIPSGVWLSSLLSLLWDSQQFEAYKALREWAFPRFCLYFPKVGWSEILGLLFWLSCMPVASQAQPVMITFVKTRYYTRNVLSSKPWKTSMDKRIPIWDDILFGHKVVVKQLSLLLGKFSFSDLPSLKSQSYCLCLGMTYSHPTHSKVEGLWSKSPGEIRATST